MIDLHSHSSQSDGILSPAALAEMAAREGLSALALTDHDTMDGVPEFVRAAEPLGLRAVPGVEVSAELADHTLHLLGYFADPANPRLNEMLRRIREGRENRNRRILENLNAIGMSVSPEDVANLSGERVVGRPHIARAMVLRGYVRNLEEAFRKYLARGCPAYAERYRCEPEEILERIHEAGGTVSLAHPGLMRMGRKEKIELVERLVAAGLDGIEATYPEHTLAQERQFRALVRKHDLICTGGSDFHDPRFSHRRLGRNRAEPLELDPDVIERLASRG